MGRQWIALAMVMALGCGTAGRPPPVAAESPAAEAAPPASPAAEAVASEPGGAPAAEATAVAPPVEEVSPPPVCPRTYSAARDLSVNCQARGAGAWECAYDEGGCRCVWPVANCGGKFLPPPEPEHFHWSCVAKPPKIRADGCPGTPPEVGSACRKAKTCVYAEVCRSKFQCAKGKWVDVPVPPMP